MFPGSLSQANAWKICFTRSLSTGRQLSGYSRPNPDPHSVLGLHKNASRSEIKSAYIRLSKLHHPDRNPNCSNAQQEFQAVREAYDALISSAPSSVGGNYSTTQHQSRSNGAENEWNTQQNWQYQYQREDWELRRDRLRNFSDAWVKRVEQNGRMRHVEDLGSAL